MSERTSHPSIHSFITLLERSELQCFQPAVTQQRGRSLIKCTLELISSNNCVGVICFWKACCFWKVCCFWRVFFPEKLLLVLVMSLAEAHSHHLYFYFASPRSLTGSISCCRMKPTVLKWLIHLSSSRCIYKCPYK